MSLKISIIIPVYNEEEHLRKLISHIRTTSLGVDYEILVSDGGSTDDTRGCISGANIKWLQSPKKGRAAQMNHGAEMAEGDIFFFLHADSVTPVGFLQKILWEVKDGTDAGCFRLKFDTQNLFLKANAWFTRFNVDAVRFGDQGLFVTRERFRRAGGYREDHIVLEDQEMVRRLKAEGARFRVIPDSIVTSARKYEQNGAVKLQYVFFLIWLGYIRGRSQRELVSMYKSKISDSKISYDDGQSPRKTANDLHQESDSGESKNTTG